MLRVGMLFVSAVYSSLSMSYMLGDIRHPTPSRWYRGPELESESKPVHLVYKSFLF